MRRLDESGLIQVGRLTAHLKGRPISRVLSSPSVRCIETVEPLAAGRDLTVEVCHQLAEGASAVVVVDLLGSLAGQDVALCSHGDVIPEVIRRLISRGMVVTDETGYSKGSLWTLHTDGSRIVEGTYDAF